MNLIKVKELLVPLTAFQDHIYTYNQFEEDNKSLNLKTFWDVPGGPVVKTSCSQSRGPTFNPWSGN